MTLLPRDNAGILASSAAFSALFMLLVVVSVPAASAMPVSQTQSTNAAGYLAQNSVGGSVMGVSGAFTVPALKCGPGENSQAYVSIGVDTTFIVARNGLAIEMGCNNGSPAYAAAVFIAGSSTTLSNPVAAGDKITTSAGLTPMNGGGYSVKVSVKDASRTHSSWSVTSTGTDGSAPEQSALWIVSIVSTPMSNFGKISFKNVDATFGENSGSFAFFVSASSITPYQYQLVSSTTPPSHALAQTGPVTSRSTGFSVTWKAAS